jgi:hypothetical protein
MWGRIKNASLDAAKQARYSWAASNNATEQDLKDLEVRLQSIKTKAELKGDSLVAGMTPGFGGVRGTMGRMSAQYGGAALGVGTAVSMLGPQAESPSGLTQGLGAAGMAAMMIPGGQLAGVGLMVAGAISSGFDKAAEDEKKRLEKIKEIRIARATVINESVETAKTGIAALVAQGVDVSTATTRYNRQISLAEGMSGYDANIKKNKGESDEDFEARKTKNEEKKSNAAAAIDAFTQSGLFKGEKGGKEVEGLLKQFGSLTDSQNALYGNNPQKLVEDLLKIKSDGYYDEKTKKTYKGKEAFDKFYENSGAANSGAGLSNVDGGSTVVWDKTAGGAIAPEASAKISRIFQERDIAKSTLGSGWLSDTQAYQGEMVTRDLKKAGLTSSIALPDNKSAMWGLDTDYFKNQLAPRYQKEIDKVLLELNAKADLPDNQMYVADKSGQVIVKTLTDGEVDRKKRELESQTIYQGIWDTNKEMLTAYREKKAEGITLKIVDKDGKPIDVQALANG